MTASPRSPRVVVVTGGSLGIGREIARAFAAAGDRVVICARGVSDLEVAARDLAADGAEVEALRCDVADVESVEGLVTTVLDRHGRIDVLVNNAGVYGPVGPTWESPLDAWEETVVIDLLGVFRMIRAVVPGMVERGEGSVINLSGGGATGPKPGYSAYAAAKTAVVRLTETLAHELAPHGVRVNAIAPGFVATRLHRATLDAGELAPDREAVERNLAQGGQDPRLAAELAVVLASPSAAGISGRLISAVWDDWRDEAALRESLEGSDLYTLRRIDDVFFAEVRRP